MLEVNIYLKFQLEMVRIGTNIGESMMYNNSPHFQRFDPPPRAKPVSAWTGAVPEMVLCIFLFAVVMAAAILLP